MTRKYLTAVAAAGLAALAVAGCGGSSSSSPMAAAGSGPAVNSTSTALGKIVTDAQGRTLYLFAGDKGMKSNCSGACATNWRPYTTANRPAAGSGVTAGSITLIKRAGGASQVALSGHPLYYFTGDQSAGQINGQGVSDFGAKWWAVAPSGAQVTVAAKSGNSGSSTSSGGGYSY